MKTTDEMLDALSTIGQPSLSKMEDGTWYAKIKFPAPDGVTASVDSGFKHPTHRSALDRLVKRLRGLQEVGDNTAKALVALDVHDAHG